MTEAPVNYDADTAGALIGRTGNWMKTQARAGKIPFTRVGRSMRWTPQHLSEILRAGEQKPRAGLVARAPARKRPAAGTQKLQAKTPQRKRSAA